MNNDIIITILKKADKINLDNGFAKLDCAFVGHKMYIDPQHYDLFKLEHTGTIDFDMPEAVEAMENGTLDSYLEANLKEYHSKIAKEID